MASKLLIPLLLGTICALTVVTASESGNFKDSRLISMPTATREKHILVLVAQAAIKYCAVQHYVLCVFKKVLEGASYYIELFSVRVGVWEVVFCEYYFYFGLAGLEIPAYKEVKQPTKNDLG